MKKLFLLTFLFPLLLVAQRHEVFIDAGIYQVVYSEVLQQPLEVKYKVQCPNGTASRSGMDFYVVDSVITSDNKDYENNVWDKGHMAPAADFNCSTEMLRKTFSYLNCSLQHQDLNRGIWRLLEARERDLAKRGTVEVRILPEYKGATKLPSGAYVPVGYYKTIYLNGKPFECYYFPNEKPAYKSFNNYKIPTCSN